MNITMHATTIVGVKRNGKVAIAGDGQVTLDKTIMKSTAKKIRRLYDGKVLTGFAGVIHLYSNGPNISSSRCMQPVLICPPISRFAFSQQSPLPGVLRCTCFPVSRLTGGGVRSGVTQLPPTRR